MITVKAPVTGKVAVWALPTSDWERKRDASLGVFKYELHTDSPYQSGAVKVQEYDVTLIVPAGVDLLQRAVATLMEAKDRVLGEAQRQATEIQKQINQLLMISGPKPDPVEVEGEFLSATEIESPSDDGPYIDDDLSDVIDTMGV